MTGEVGWAIIAHKVKVAHQPLHSSIRVNWEFSSNCGTHISGKKNAASEMGWPHCFLSNTVNFFQKLVSLENKLSESLGF